MTNKSLSLSLSLDSEPLDHKNTEYWLYYLNVSL